MLKHIIRIQDVDRAIEIASTHGKLAGIVGYPDSYATRIYSVDRPFLGQAFSLWETPVDMLHKPMSARKRRQLARGIHTDLMKKLNAKTEN
ncbi:MAG TPA: hypothetical protein PLZ51_29300 [Aggregatilineales bacterium]|nr:hypothetical protein [Aggregatilineales bacterium]